MVGGAFSGNLGAGMLLTLERVWDEEQEGSWRGGVSVSLIPLLFSALALVFCPLCRWTFPVCSSVWLLSSSHLNLSQFKLPARTYTRFHVSEGETLTGPGLSQIPLLVPSVLAKMRLMVLVKCAWWGKGSVRRQVSHWIKQTPPSCILKVY